MRERKLGNCGLRVAEIGYGAMGTAVGYGPRDDAESTQAIRRAYELGVTMFDTAEMYGWGEGERLLGKAVAPFRGNVVIATKFGLTTSFAPNSQPDHIREVVEHSLRRLQVDTIDVLYQHVKDPNVPIEVVVSVMKEYVEAGKVKYLGLSNTDADRAFVLKCLGGLRFWRTLWGAFAIFYKDGQPFGFYDAFVEDGQVALRRNSNRGSAMQIASPLIGWREDYQVEVDLRLSYDFALGAGWQLRVAGVVANAFDLGNEVSERFGPPFDRSALELQLPRSATLSVELFEPAAPTR